ncbi:MAG TPA: hypothetical protein PKH65_08005 [Bacteroidia bacterium]|nr:hypothetical protein [Bacteroidia bacterium]HNT80609.1 hypothetical protein [Bacteroidia bacterium]
MQNSLKSACSILNQLKQILVQLNNEEFIQSLPLLNGNSIGKHCRHLVEFYDCLIQANENGRLNYDARSHNPLLEQNLHQCIDAFNSINQYLSGNVDNRVIAMNYSYEKEFVDCVETSFKRELVYNIEHCVHHMAIIKIAIEQSFPHIQIPSYFGVAHSTIVHQQKECAQ